jgi:molybdenum cofactor cytidylyltransferase
VSSVSAVLLAAGESRRMGTTNKLCLAVDGVPLLRRTTQTLLASRLEEIVVVLGYQAETARSLIEGLPVSVVVNEKYREGQMTSVHRGLESLSAASDGVMICLSDQTLLQPEDINHLVDAFLNRSSGSILVPTYQGRRGNPIVFDYKHRESILNGDRNLGCKRLIEKNPDLVTTIEVGSDHFVVDLDTPEDYLALQQLVSHRINTEIATYTGEEGKQ